MQRAAQAPHVYWECAQCDFANAPGAHFCDICTAPRVKRPTQGRSSQPQRTGATEQRTGGSRPNELAWRSIRTRAGRNGSRRGGRGGSSSATRGRVTRGRRTATAKPTAKAPVGYPKNMFAHVYRMRRAYNPEVDARLLEVGRSPTSSGSARRSGSAGRRAGHDGRSRWGGPGVPSSSPSRRTNSRSPSRRTNSRSPSRRTNSRSPSRRTNSRLPSRRRAGRSPAGAGRHPVPRHGRVVTDSLDTSPSPLDGQRLFEPLAVNEGRLFEPLPPPRTFAEDTALQFVMRAKHDVPVAATAHSRPSGGTGPMDLAGEHKSPEEQSAEAGALSGGRELEGGHGGAGVGAGAGLPEERKEEQPDDADAPAESPAPGEESRKGTRAHTDTDTQSHGRSDIPDDVMTVPPRPLEGRAGEVEDGALSVPGVELPQPVLPESHVAGLQTQQQTESSVARQDHTTPMSEQEARSPGEEAYDLMFGDGLPDDTPVNELPVIRPAVAQDRPSAVESAEEALQQSRDETGPEQSPSKGSTGTAELSARDSGDVEPASDSEGEAVGADDHNRQVSGTVEASMPTTAHQGDEVVRDSPAQPIHSAADAGTASAQTISAGSSAEPQPDQSPAQPPAQADSAARTVEDQAYELLYGSGVLNTPEIRGGPQDADALHSAADSDQALTTPQSPPDQVLATPPSPDDMDRGLATPQSPDEHGEHDAGAPVGPAASDGRRPGSAATAEDALVASGVQITDLGADLEDASSSDDTAVYDPPGSAPGLDMVDDDENRAPGLDMVDDDENTGVAARRPVSPASEVDSYDEAEVDPRVCAQLGDGEQGGVDPRISAAEVDEGRVDPRVSGIDGDASQDAPASSQQQGGRASQHTQAHHQSAEDDDAELAKLNSPEDPYADMLDDRSDSDPPSGASPVLNLRAIGQQVPSQHQDRGLGHDQLTGPYGDLPQFVGGSPSSGVNAHSPLSPGVDALRAAMVSTPDQDFDDLGYSDGDEQTEDSDSADQAAAGQSERIVNASDLLTAQPAGVRSHVQPSPFAQIASQLKQNWQKHHWDKTTGECCICTGHREGRRPPISPAQPSVLCERCRHEVAAITSATPVTSAPQHRTPAPSSLARSDLSLALSPDGETPAEPCAAVHAPLCVTQVVAVLTEDFGMKVDLSVLQEPVAESKGDRALPGSPGAQGTTALSLDSPRGLHAAAADEQPGGTGRYGAGCESSSREVSGSFTGEPTPTATPTPDTSDGEGHAVTPGQYGASRGVAADGQQGGRDADGWSVERVASGITWEVPPTDMIPPSPSTQASHSDSAAHSAAEKQAPGQFVAGAESQGSRDDLPVSATAAAGGDQPRRMVLVPLKQLSPQALAGGRDAGDGCEASGPVDPIAHADSAPGQAVAGASDGTAGSAAGAQEDRYAAAGPLSEPCCGAPRAMDRLECAVAQFLALYGLVFGHVTAGGESQPGVFNPVVRWLGDICLVSADGGRFAWHNQRLSKPDASCAGAGAATAKDSAGPSRTRALVRSVLSVLLLVLLVLIFVVWSEERVGARYSCQWTDLPSNQTSSDAAGARVCSLAEHGRPLLQLGPHSSALSSALVFSPLETTPYILFDTDVPQTSHRLATVPDMSSLQHVMGNPWSALLGWMGLLDLDPLTGWVSTVHPMLVVDVLVASTAPTGTSFYAMLCLHWVGAVVLTLCLAGALWVRYMHSALPTSQTAGTIPVPWESVQAVVDGYRASGHSDAALEDIVRISGRQLRSATDALNRVSLWAALAAYGVVSFAVLLFLRHYVLLFTMGSVVSAGAFGWGLLRYIKG